MLPSNPVLLRAMSQAIDQQLRQPSSPPPPPPPSEEQQAARKRRQALAARILRGEDDPDEPMMEDEDEDEDEDDGANEPVEGDHEDDTLDGEDPIYDYSDYDESLDDYLEEDYYYYYGDYYSEINQTDSQEPQDKPFDIIEFLDNVDINVRLMPHITNQAHKNAPRLTRGVCVQEYAFMAVVRYSNRFSCYIRSTIDMNAELIEWTNEVSEALGVNYPAGMSYDNSLPLACCWCCMRRVDRSHSS